MGILYLLLLIGDVGKFLVRHVYTTPSLSTVKNAKNTPFLGSSCLGHMSSGSFGSILVD